MSHGHPATCSNVIHSTVVTCVPSHVLQTHSDCARIKQCGWWLLRGFSWRGWSSRLLRLFQQSARQCSPGQACKECAHFHAQTLTNDESLCDFLLITMRIGLLILGTKCKVKFSSTFGELEWSISSSLKGIFSLFNLRGAIFPSNRSIFPSQSGEEMQNNVTLRSNFPIALSHNCRMKVLTLWEIGLVVCAKLSSLIRECSFIF